MNRSLGLMEDTRGWAHGCWGTGSPKFKERSSTGKLHVVGIDAEAVRRRRLKPQGRQRGAIDAFGQGHAEGLVGKHVGALQQLDRMRSMNHALPGGVMR